MTQNLTQCPWTNESFYEIKKGDTIFYRHYQDKDGPIKHGTAVKFSNFFGWTLDTIDQDGCNVSVNVDYNYLGHNPARTP
jgi:hypothetical protein